MITSAGDSFEIRMFGRGAHGSMPQASIDPVVMAAATVLRLQTIVSREVAPSDAAVVTVGALQAGTKENVIPDEAVIKLNVRTFDEDVRKHVLDAIERIVNAEAAGLRRAKAAGDHRARPLRPRAQRRGRRPSGCAMRFAPTSAMSGSTDTGPDLGERGLRLVRGRVACAVGVLVCRRHRPRDLRQGRARRAG